MANTIWINTYKYLYNINLDGEDKKYLHDGLLDYKKTIAAFKAKGYSKVFITYLGRVQA